MHEYSSALKFYSTFRENYRLYFNIAIAEAHQKHEENLHRAEGALNKRQELEPSFERAKTLMTQIAAVLRSAA